jgi:prevent-host-death family protein
MAILTIREAKVRLSKLIARAEAGEEIIIARGRKPVVRLQAIAPRKGKRTPGRLAGKFNLPDEFFFDPLPEEELKPWEGRTRRD